MSALNIGKLLNGIMNGLVRFEDVTSVLNGAPSPPPSPISWDEAENRKFEYGVSKGILFLMNDDGTYSRGKPWNGLTNITDQPEGAEPTKFYADGIYYAGVSSTEQYRGSIEAFTYPDAFSECDGSMQPTPGMYIGQQKRRRLSDLAPICNPGSFAFNQDMSRMWQLDANETWVRMI